MDGSIKVEGTETAASAGIPRRAIRNIALLAMCQALTQSCNTLMFASSALAVLTIVSPGMREFANLPVTMQHLGVMLSVFPASMLMMRRIGLPAMLIRSSSVVRLQSSYFAPIITKTMRLPSRGLHQPCQLPSCTTTSPGFITRSPSSRISTRSPSSRMP